MKLTKKKLVYLLLELFFIAIVPVVLVVLQYGKIADEKFMIGLTGILLLLVIFIICRKVVLRRWLENLRGQIVNFQSDLKTENDEGKIANIERELKSARTVEVLFNAVMPLMFLVLMVYMCKALEAQLVELSGVLGFIAVSFVVGTVFSVLSAREVVSKNKEKKK